MQFVKEALCSELSRQLLSTLDIVSCLLEYPEGMLDHHRDRKAWCVKQVIGHLIEEDRRDFAQSPSARARRTSYAATRTRHRTSPPDHHRTGRQGFAQTPLRRLHLKAKWSNECKTVAASLSKFLKKFAVDSVAVPGLQGNRVLIESSATHASNGT